MGFAWQPRASRLFHATAARLAEALPVALWYFFDEDGLRRCELHRGGGPLFDAYCARCEAAHALGPDDAMRDERWAQGGLAFLERELRAAERSMNEGRVIPNRYATLDLGSDGLAYAASHADRLSSSAFAGYVDAFFPDGAGRCASLEALAARVREVAADLTGGPQATALVGGRSRWIAQDVAWRLLQVAEDTDGDAAAELSRMVKALADAPNDQGVAAAVDAYGALTADFELPEAADVFAVGYELLGDVGRSTGQITSGIRSGLPATTVFLGDDLAMTVGQFSKEDPTVRLPLGRRFSDWLGRAQHPATPLAGYEAALAHAPAPDLEALTLAPDRLGLEGVDSASLSDCAILVRAPWDVVGYASAVDAGRKPRMKPSATSVVVTRAADGDVLVVPVSEDDAAALAARGPVTARDQLMALGAVSPRPVAAPEGAQGRVVKSRRYG